MIELVYVLILTFGAFNEKLVMTGIATKWECIEKAGEMVEKYRLALPKDIPLDHKWRTAKWKCKEIQYRFSMET